MVNGHCGRGESWSARGRWPSREASALALRRLEHRCGSLSAATSARIEALSRARLEKLALALLDVRSAEDLHTWLQPLQSSKRTRAR
jgi:hypothetical protein